MRRGRCEWRLLDARRRTREQQICHVLRSAMSSTNPRPQSERSARTSDVATHLFLFIGVTFEGPVRRVLLGVLRLELVRELFMSPRARSTEMPGA